MSGEGVLMWKERQSRNGPLKDEEAEPLQICLSNCKYDGSATVSVSQLEGSRQLGRCCSPGDCMKRPASTQR